MVTAMIKPKRWLTLTPCDKATVIDMVARRVPYATITDETGCSCKMIRMILDEAGIDRQSTRRAKRKKSKTIPRNEPNGIPAAIDSRIFLVGFEAPPAWVLPYVETGRVYQGVQS